jgi:hypothetical protein
MVSEPGLDVIGRAAEPSHTSNLYDGGPSPGPDVMPVPRLHAACTFMTLGLVNARGAQPGGRRSRETVRFWLRSASGPRPKVPWAFRGPTQRHCHVNNICSGRERPLNGSDP